MFAEYVYEKSSAAFSDRVILIDADNLEIKTKYSEYFAEHGFQVIRYVDDLHLRLEHEDAISGDGRFLLIASRDQYIPYDVIHRFRIFDLSISNLFPKLNSMAINAAPCMDYDLLTLAYRENYSDLHFRQLTEQFIQTSVFSARNIKKLLAKKNKEMHKAAENAVSYKDWCLVANLKAVIDIKYLTKQGRLTDLVKQLLKNGFDVYISADHGNTPCTGMGKLMKTGVEIETKSRRMLVLKDFADKQALIDQYDLIEFPKYFLNKEFDYLICGVGRSFDAKGDEVMSHGGITVDEVIVPFIKIKAVENNG